MHPHLADELFPKEVPHLNESAALTDGAVDGEMGIDGPHLVEIALGDTVDHVVDVGADSPHCSQLLLASKPFFNLDGVLVWFINIHRQVAELLGKGTASSFDSHLASFDGHINNIRDSDNLETVYVLHFGTFSCRSESSSISL